MLVYEHKLAVKLCATNYDNYNVLLCCAYFTYYMLYSSIVIACECDILKFQLMTEILRIFLPSGFSEW